MKDGYMYIRHDQYLQMVYQKFLVAQNGIKKGSRNTYIFFYLRKFSRFWGQMLLSTNAVLENLPQNRDNFLM